MSILSLPRSSALRSALTAVAVAQVAGMSLNGPGRVPATASALSFAVAMVIVGVAVDPKTHPAAASRVSGAWAWSALLAAGTMLLVALNARVHDRASLALGLGVGAGVLAFALSGSARLLTSVLGDAVRARLAVLVVLALTGAAPLWLGPAAERLAETKRVLNAIVAASPLTYLAVMCDYDYLHSHWFYVHTPVASLRFDYPGALTSSVVYLTLGLLSAWLSLMVSTRTR